MSIERYLGAYYPIFHRTSVTRRRLLTLLAILLMFTIVMFAIFRGSLVIYSILNDIILVALFFPPFIFVNFKLFIIARKVHRERAVSQEKRKRKNLKNISAALWVVGCLMLLYLPTSLNIAINLAGKSLNTIRFSTIWGHIYHHELHIEQFDNFLEEQSFTHRRDKDTKDIERSYCLILNKNFVVFIKGHICQRTHLSASDRPKRTITK